MALSLLAGRNIQNFRHTGSSLHSSSFTAGQTDDEMLSTEPSEQCVDGGSQAASPGAGSLPDSPSHCSPVPEALMRNVAQLDRAAADLHGVPSDTCVQDVLLRNAAQLDSAAAATPQILRSPVPPVLQQHSEQLRNAAAGTLQPAGGKHSPASQGELTSTGQQTRTVPRGTEAASDQHTFAAAAVLRSAEQRQAMARSDNSQRQHAAECQTEALAAGSTTSAEFTRVSAGTDGHLNVVEKVYFATPDALAGVVIPEHAHAAASEAVPAATAAAPSSPAAADTAADALLEASLTELAHEPVVPKSTAQDNPDFPPQSHAAHVVSSALGSASSTQQPPPSTGQTRAAPAGSSQHTAKASHHLTGIHVDSPPTQASDALQQQVTTHSRQLSEHAVLSMPPSPDNSKSAHVLGQASPALFSPVASTAGSLLHSMDAKAKQGNTPGHRQHSPYAASQRGPASADRDAALRKAAELQRQLNLTSTKLQV